MGKLHETRLKKIVELYNSGITVRSDLQKELGMSIYTINKYMCEAKERGLISGKKYKLETLVELYKSGITDIDQLSEMLEVKTSTVRGYISVARKQGMLEKKEKKGKNNSSIIKIAELYNSGVTDISTISETLEIGKRSASTYLSEARRKGLITNLREENKIKIADLYNSGLKEKEISETLELSRKTVKHYLDKAIKEGLISYKEKSKDDICLQTRVIEELKDKYPREVAESLGISPKQVYDVIDNLKYVYKKKIKKAQLQKNPLYNRMKELINEKGMDTRLALHYLYRSITDPIEQINLSKLYYIADGLDMSETILQEVISDKGIDMAIRKSAYQEREKIHIENISRKIRGHYKISQNETNHPISYDELCRRYCVRTGFVVDILGEENREYGE